MDESLGFSGTFERPFRIERLVFQRRKLFKQGSQVKGLLSVAVGSMLVCVCVCVCVHVSKCTHALEVGRICLLLDERVTCNNNEGQGSV